MAVAQAQHAVRELAKALERRGVEVKFAIHPVAGRMPGHMNVLLAEADVPYDQLKEMDEINGEFGRTDVSLVIGANDVTNPDARTRSPTRRSTACRSSTSTTRASVIVLKRSMNSGFAGIDNPLFYNPKTAMLFGDAKSSVSEVTPSSARSDAPAWWSAGARRRTPRMSRTIRDARFDGRVTFLVTAADSDGALLRTRSVLGPRFPAPPLHVHPHQTRALRGAPRPAAGHPRGAHPRPRSGDTLEVAPGVAHTFAVEGTAEVDVTVTSPRPATWRASSSPWPSWPATAA